MNKEAIAEIRRLLEQADKETQKERERQEQIATCYEIAVGILKKHGEDLKDFKMSPHRRTPDVLIRISEQGYNIYLEQGSREKPGGEDLQNRISVYIKEAEKPALQAPSKLLFSLTPHSISSLNEELTTPDQFEGLKNVLRLIVYRISLKPNPVSVE